MRPMFVFLVAKMLGDERLNDRTYRGASVIELIHTATLVHDDVVDDSYRRRGFFSLNALWKNKIAVLVGDFLLSKGLDLPIEDFDKFVGVDDRLVHQQFSRPLQPAQPNTHYCVAFGHSCGHYNHYTLENV